MKLIRTICAGVNQLNLSKLYLQHMHDCKKRWIFRSTVSDLPNAYYCVQIPALKSRMSGDGTHTAYLLFDETSFVDSMCTCGNMARSIPCAHRGTALVALYRKQNNMSLVPDETASVEKRKAIVIPRPMFAGGWKDQGTSS